MVCCFTGHRPNKLGGYNYNSVKNLEIKEKIRKNCIDLIEKNKVDTFIFGGALGLDQMAFDVCFELKINYNIKLIIAVPFEKQYGNWLNNSVSYYKEQLSKADNVVFVDTLERYSLKNINEGIYHPAKMQKRNQYMVDNSDYIIAYWDGSSGGTKNCLDYWNKTKNNKPINIF